MHTVDIHARACSLFDGLWEAAVKSFKIHLRAVVGEARLKYKELTTTMAQVECLNLRPLTPLPES